MAISLTFFGSAETVTGSAIYLATPRGEVLLDCGLFQGPKSLQELNYRRLPFDAKRLDATKSNLRYSFAMSLDTAQSVASHLTRFIGLSADPATINAAYLRYDEVTPDDLMRVAGKYLTRARSTEVTLVGGAQ